MGREKTYSQEKVNEILKNLRLVHIVEAKFKWTEKDGQRYIERNYTPLTGIYDKNGTEVQAGDLLEDSHQGRLYKVVYDKGAYVMVSTGFVINEDRVEVDFIGFGRRSLIYDNWTDFKERHQVVKLVKAAPTDKKGSEKKA